MRPTTPTARILAGLTAAATVIVLGSAPAGAETQSFTDPHGDAPRFGDISSVRTVFDASHLDVTVGFRRARLVDGTDLWIDTDRSDPGPEFKATYDLESIDKIRVYRADDFGKTRRKVCESRTGSYDSGRPSVRLRVPTSCLDDAAEVRVNVVSYDNSGPYGGAFADAAPGRKTLPARWVAR